MYTKVNNMKKLIIIGTIVIVILSAIYYFYYNYVPKTDSTNYPRFACLISDSAQHNIIRKYYVSYVYKTSIQAHLGYHKNYNIMFWEFFTLSNPDLRHIDFFEGVNLSNFIPDINEKDDFNRSPGPQITNRIGCSLEGKITVNISKNTAIQKWFDEPDYRGFLGTTDGIGLSTGEDKSQILFKWDEPGALTLFLLYRKNDSLFIIILNGEVPFDESILSIFNFINT